MPLFEKRKTGKKARRNTCNKPYAIIKMLCSLMDKKCGCTKSRADTKKEEEERKKCLFTLFFLAFFFLAFFTLLLFCAVK